MIIKTKQRKFKACKKRQILRKSDIKRLAKLDNAVRNLIIYQDYEIKLKQLKLLLKNSEIIDAKNIIETKRKIGNLLGRQKEIFARKGKLPKLRETCEFIIFENNICQIKNINEFNKLFYKLNLKNLEIENNKKKIFEYLEKKWKAKKQDIKYSII
ncbi:MAG: hypothetical protein V1824_02080 [archaeon]